MFVSIAIHVVLLFIAGFFIAVEVVPRLETDFKGKEIVRPKINLKKLRVPVKFKNVALQQAPKASQRIVTPPPIKTQSVDFTVPDITGLGNGISMDISGAGFGGSLGFAVTKLNIFGLESSGEKVVFLLSTSAKMLTDDIGGIPAYTIIKNELTGLIGTLPPTALFNVMIHDDVRAVGFSKEWAQASDANLSKLKSWLAPLNQDNKKYGLETLASPGHPMKFEPSKPIYEGITWKTQYGWIHGLAHSLQRGAESVYILGRRLPLNWIEGDVWRAREKGIILEKSRTNNRVVSVDYSGVGGIAKWKATEARAEKLHKEENEARIANGQPVRVLPRRRYIVARTYLPKEKLPQVIIEGNDDLKTYTASEVIQYIQLMSAKSRAKEDDPVKLVLKKKKPVSVNIIQFVSKEYEDTSLMQSVGEQLEAYKQLRGLTAIRSSARKT